MKVLGILLAIFLWLLGGLFLLAAAAPDAVAQGKSLPRAVVGGGLVLGGFVLLVLAWRMGGSRAAEGGGSGSGPRTISGQDPPGGLSLKTLTCPHCGGQVDPASARLNPEGTLSVTCAYCKGAFLVQEDPKW
jgi:hypothetical protein